METIKDAIAAAFCGDLAYLSIAASVGIIILIPALAPFL